MPYFTQTSPGNHRNSIRVIYIDTRKSESSKEFKQFFLKVFIATRFKPGQDRIKGFSPTNYLG
ncbi:MAG: hypothetical protein ABIO55_08135 [Ginsengibacter sp.]